ncbi:MAG: nucleotidyltransferase family protein [Elusimicrobia bacterium]|nr:nucleotidyltransferase family protein [Elusimicrobiota bacterium]
MIAAQACLLAAGRGQRAGGPKAWQLRDGKPLLQSQLDFLGSQVASGAVAVSIQSDWVERCRALRPDAHWVAVDPDKPPMASIVALLKTRPMTSWFFLYHVDMPVWEPRLFSALAARIPQAEASACDAIVPVKDGRRGHPVLLSPAAGKALAEMDPAVDRLDAWLRTRRVDAVEVPFACILENWNAGA